MPTINEVKVADNLTSLWGIDAYEYEVGNKQVDFQDLMVAVGTRRAVTVEGEVQPLLTRIRARNKDLEDLGTALSELTSAQATLSSGATGDTASSFTFGNATKSRILNLTGQSISNNECKKNLEYFIQMVKTEIDSLNNQSQVDMSRLQSLVDRRDESYSTSSNLMTSVSDTRSNLIKNL